jgi:ABC-type branched-subunit amino acid transport system permease subunit
VVLVPGLLALVFGWLAFRSRVTGVYLSILTQAMTLALSLYLFQNDSGLRGNNGLSGLQNLPGLATCRNRRCRCGSSGPRRWRWGWAICCAPGSCRASSAR